jgi:hypothetical protein
LFLSRTFFWIIRIIRSMDCEMDYDRQACFGIKIDLIHGI